MSDGILLSDYLRSQAAWYIKQWIGKPYKWGGDDFSGFDCSGLIHEVLQGVGLEKRGFDCTARELYEAHKDNEIEKGYGGCLVFWFKNGVVIHVEMMVDDYLVVGASGGGSETQSEEDAISDNAYIMMNDLHYRGGNFKIVDPFK